MLLDAKASDLPRDVKQRLLRRVKQNLGPQAYAELLLGEGEEGILDQALRASRSKLRGASAFEKKAFRGCEELYLFSVESAPTSGMLRLFWTVILVSLFLVLAAPLVVVAYGLWRGAEFTGGGVGAWWRWLTGHWRKSR